MKPFALFAAALSLTGLLGCQAEDDLGTDESNQTEAGSCAYSGEANDLYKQAVEQAKRYESSTCEVLQADVWQLADEAVEACPAIGGLIASSQWAGALREVLGPLQVAHFAGQLQNKKGGFDATMVGIALDEGQTFWSPGLGAYGSWQIMHFAGGAFETETLVTEDEGMTIERRVTDTGSFSFATAEDGALLVRIESSSQPARDLRFELVEDEYSGADLFRLTPAEGATDPNRQDQLFNMHMSECDA